MKLWKLFLKTMKVMGNRCTAYLMGIFFMSACMAAFWIISSMFLKYVIDAAQTGNSRQMPYVTAGSLAAGIVVLLIYRAFAIIYNVEAKRAYGKLCNMVFWHEIHLPYSYYETHHSGDFLSKMSYDLEKTGDIYGSRLRRTVSPLLQVIVFLVPMMILSWQITLCLVGVNLILLFINGLLIQPIRRVSGELSVANGKMTEKLSNLLQGMEQARMYEAGKNTVREFTEESEAYARKYHKKIFYTACLEGCDKGFDLLCTLAFLILGIFFVQNGYTTLGALTAIYSLYGNFSYQFLQLGRYLPELIGCLANARNIFEFMEEAREPESWYGDEKEAEAFENEERAAYIDISNITFFYREDKPLLKNLSLQIDKGESIAVTGPSGCGKTTLSKLLLGLYPVLEGDISVGGESYRSMDNRKIRSRIAYVPQEPYLFNMSVKENIRLGKQDASEEEVIQAAKAAHAHEFILKLEKGYDTNVGERGNRLSGGQKQRIAIARAILKDAPIVLMDEATSALDNESEQLVNDALKSMKHSRNIIMIAHRPSTIALADRVCAFGTGIVK